LDYPEVAQEEHVQQLIGHLFRHEAGKMAAVLSRMLGSNYLSVAEDIVQDTLIKAMDTWAFHGVPENPQAWLYTVAKNKVLDFLRSEKRHHQIESEISNALHSEWAIGASVNQLFLEHEIQDSQLRMMFACCHPSIPVESQIALTLKVLCGLSVYEIASAFLTNHETIQKRIVRAKEKLREEKIHIDLPSSLDMTDRLETVLKTLYLLFNEGYYSTNHADNIREDLCLEAMRLTYLLEQNPLTNLPKVRALLALMCLHVSRFDARTDEDGSMILLEDQDRSKWNKNLINKGIAFLEKASDGNELSDYHLEAAIASVHVQSPDFQNTDWQKILMLYNLLLELKPSPMVELNRAIAAGYALGAQEGLTLLKKITSMESSNLYYTAIGNFESSLGNRKEAKQNYERAFSFTNSEKEKILLKGKIQSLEENLH
jgi:RNA polymerase sigma factor (sigma-70 family)